MKDTPVYNPAVKPLPRAQRRFIFLFSFILFLCAVPVFVFYATGYRYNIFAPDRAITATGGLYITIDADAGELYLNEELVRDVRIFRSASYIQNLLPGVQHVHVQGDGLHTWVKDLPVYPHIVTEAEAFLMPKTPQLRLITEYTTAAGAPVVIATTTTADAFAFGSSTLPIFTASSTATSSYLANSEYEYVLQLFGTTTTETEDTLIGRVIDGVSGTFQFASTTMATTTDVLDEPAATTTKQRGDTVLYEKDDDIFVSYTGPDRDIPYYFCVPAASLASTTELYGAAVMSGVRAALLEARADEADIKTLTETNARICRKEIRINDGGHDVLSFDFFPNSTDLVVLHRTDGIFVVEVDDRSWQNAQLIYPDSALAMVIDNGRIYVEDQEGYVELLTELSEN